jgi:hypothetical protein
MIANYKRSEFTDTAHCLNEFTDTGHCLSPSVSGTFLMLTQNGNLMMVCEMIQQRAEIAAEIQQVEQRLLSCNHPYALSDLGVWHEHRHRNFGAELIQLTEKLETRKCELRAALRQIDERLAQQNLGFEWSMLPEFVRLVPEGRFNVVATLRTMLIDQNRMKSHEDICRILDSQFRPNCRPEGFFREEWQEKYGVTTFLEAYRHPKCRNLVDKMFSSAKRRGP